MKSLFVIFISVVLLLLISGPALSEESDSDPKSDTLTLQAITVTATRAERELMQVPISVSIVDETKIDREPAITVADHLRSVPGVYLNNRTTIGYRNTIMIRGFSSARVIVLIDNIRESFPATINFKGQFSVDPSQIESIEVIKGPASVLYGSDAIGGVVKITTKKGGGKPFGAVIKTTYSSLDESFTPYAAIYGEKNGFYFRISGTGSDKGNQRVYKRETVRNSESSFQDYMVKLGYKWDDGELIFSGSHFVSDNKEPFFIWDTSGYIHQNPTQVDSSPRKYFDRDSYAISLTKNNIKENLKKLSVSAFYQKLRDGWVETSLLTNLDLYNSDERYSSYGLTAQTDWNFFDTHSFSLGVDYTSDKLDLKTTVGRIRDYDIKQQTLAIFAQDEWTPIDKWSFIAGLRQTWINLEFKKNNPGTLETDGSRKYKIFVGSLGVVYRPTDNMALRAHFSQGYKTPTANNLYAGNMQTQANPNLKPEKSNNYELGARYDNGKLTFDAALFLSFFKDAITSRQISANPQRFEMINATRQKSYGLELVTSYRIGNTGFSPYLEMTLMKAEMEYQNGFKSKDTGVPHTWGRLGVRFSRDIGEQEFFSNLAYRFTDIYRLRSSVTRLVTQTYEAQRYIDLSFGIQGPTSFGKYLISVSIDNLAN
jgi:hemoglobin/transferrin/lactoferrin receptor protein